MSKAKAKKIVVKQDPAHAEIPFEVMASAVKEIGDAMFFLRSSRATEKMIVALIKDHTGHTKGTIENVLHSLQGLEQNYLKPRKQ